MAYTLCSEHGGYVLSTHIFDVIDKEGKKRKVCKWCMNKLNEKEQESKTESKLGQ